MSAVSHLVCHIKDRHFQTNLNFYLTILNQLCTLVHEKSDILCIIVQFLSFITLVQFQNQIPMIKDRDLYQQLIQHLDKKEYSIIIGARQVGKTTLIQQLYGELKKSYSDVYYISLENPKILHEINLDPENLFHPLIIIEVLSKSTEAYDRGKKFQFYRSLPSFKEYILIDQYSVHIDQFYTDTQGKWILTDYNDSQAILKFAKIDFEIPLEKIYHLVDFKLEETEAADGNR